MCIHQPLTRTLILTMPFLTLRMWRSILSNYKNTRTCTYIHTNCRFSSVFLDKSAKVLTFRNANCSNSSVLLRVSFQIHLLALTRCPLTAHLSARQEGVSQDKSAPLLTHLGGCWCLDNEPRLLETDFPNPGVLARGCRWTKPVDQTANAALFLQWRSGLKGEDKEIMVNSTQNNKGSWKNSLT